MYLFMVYKGKFKPRKGRIIKFRSKRNFDKEHYKEDLCHAPWHVDNTFDTVDDKAGFWEALIASIVDKQ